MTSLQVGLTIGGGLTLAAVVLYNRWNERRKTPRRATSDVRTDPSSRSGGAEVPHSPEENRQRVEPVLAGDAPPATLAAAERHLPLDALIDSIVPIALERVPIAGEPLLGALPPTRRVGTKPFALEARRGEEPWEFPRVDRDYDAVRVGLQLAGRTGPITEIEFSEFVVKAERLADAVGGTPDFPEMAHEIARARELDHFAGQHDARLAFRLRSRSAPWSIGFVAQQAAALGLVGAAVPGRMLLPAAQIGGAPVLELKMDVAGTALDDVAQPPLTEVALGFDVPLVASADRPFERLRQFTVALADTMQGVVTDERGRPLDAAAMDAIGADLERLYAMLDQHGLPAGSPQAQRLFS